MSTLDYLERLATDFAESHGIGIKHARSMVRIAMIQVAIDFGIPNERIAAYAESFNAETKTRTEPA